MIGIYLLVTILTQMSPESLFGFPAFAPASATPYSDVAIESEIIEAEFKDLKSLKVGAPVTKEGSLIGTVLEISQAPSGTASGAGDNKNENKNFTLKLKIDASETSLINEGTIALISSPMHSGCKQPEPTVELITPQGCKLPALEENESIRGFSSFEDFWSADLGRKLPGSCRLG